MLHIPFHGGKDLLYTISVKHNQKLYILAVPDATSKTPFVIFVYHSCSQTSLSETLEHRRHIISTQNITVSYMQNSITNSGNICTPWYIQLCCIMMPSNTG